MKRKIGIVFLISVVSLLTLFLWESHEKEKAHILSEKWESERRPIRVQKEKWERQLAELNEEYRILTEPKATTQIFFTDLNEQVYSVCYPRLKSMGYTGTLVLSAEQFPGEEDCMTLEQFRELLTDGWKICIGWPKEATTDSWWTTLKQKMNASQIERSSMIYFPHGSYKSELDGKIRQMGFSIVISEKIGVESPVQENYEEGLWHLGAMGYMEAKSKVQLIDAIGKDGNIIYLVSFGISNQLYESTPFRGMIGIFQEYQLGGDLLVCDTETAREYHKNKSNGISPEVVENYQKEKEVLENEIQKLEDQLRKIDAKYR